MLLACANVVVMFRFRYAAPYQFSCVIIRFLYVVSLNLKYYICFDALLYFILILPFFVFLLFTPLRRPPSHVRT